jgi:light-regulated signal transduction histidine kinase (bacteriophytochrome)
VFQNLLSNTLKFHGTEPPRAVITVSRDGDFWLFSFTDNGIGIEPDYADRIFVIFQRLHERTAYPGTGIGLSMTRKIIEYFGGRIWLDTTYTDGARFLFTLPMPPETLNPERPETERPETLDPGRPDVLGPPNPETPLFLPQGASGDREDEETDA